MVEHTVSKKKSFLWSFVVIVLVFGVLYFFANSPVQESSSNMQVSCEDLGGTWLADYKECEYVSMEACQGLGGEFNECGSACRHQTEQVFCTLQCVPYCKV